MKRLIFILLLLPISILAQQTTRNWSVVPYFRGNVRVDDTLGVDDNVQMPYNNIYTVDTGGAADYTTVQAAITAASAWDCIRIMPGIYNEAITLKDKVDLFGVGNVVIAATGDVVEDNNVAARCTLRNIMFIDTTATTAAMDIQNASTVLYLDNVEVRCLNRHALSNYGTIIGGIFRNEGGTLRNGANNWGKLEQNRFYSSTGYGIHNRVGGSAIDIYAYSDAQSAIHNEDTVINSYGECENASGIGIRNLATGVTIGCTGTNTLGSGIVNLGASFNDVALSNGAAGYILGSPSSPAFCVAYNCIGISEEDEGFVVYPLAVANNITGYAYGGSAQEGISCIGGTVNGGSAYSTGNGKFGASVYNGAAFALGNYVGTLNGVDIYCDDDHGLTIQGDSCRVIGCNIYTSVDDAAGKGIEISGTPNGIELIDVNIEQRSATATSILVGAATKLKINNVRYTNGADGSVTFETEKGSNNLWRTNLTGGVATDVLDLSLADASWVGAKVYYTIYASDNATANAQTLSGIIMIDAVSDAAGNMDSNFSNSSTGGSATGGTGITNTVTINEDGASDKVTLRFNAVSDLTETTFYVELRVVNDSPSTITSK